MAKTALVWFTTDVRLSDNEALLKAMSEYDEVVPVFCIDASIYESGMGGFEKMGIFRRKFLAESLRQLDANLRSMGSGLLLLYGAPGEAIAAAARRFNATVVFAQHPIAYEERSTQAKVCQALRQISCGFKPIGWDTLYHPDDLPFSIRQLPDIFTVFRKKLEADWTIRKEMPTPDVLTSPPIPPMDESLLKLMYNGSVGEDTRSAFPFKGGEDAALQRLNYYLHDSRQVSQYKETRNGLVGADYSTKFSPWLAHGCISAKTIYHQIRAYESLHGANESTYWVVFELLWRDYFRFVMMKYGILLFARKGIRNGGQQPDWKLAAPPAALAKWIEGKTGVDFVDANMLELKQTGFMSNRGRQNVASYLCNDMKIDWRYGAAYFEQQLIDYDVCSNWGNWAYVAGVGNDPRSNRYFNIAKQAEMYDAAKTFRNLWLQ